MSNFNIETLKYTNGEKAFLALCTVGNVATLMSNPSGVKANLGKATLGLYFSGLAIAIDQRAAKRQGLKRKKGIAGAIFWEKKDA